MTHEHSPRHRDSGAPTSDSLSSAPAPGFTTDFIGLAAFLASQGHEPTLQAISPAKVLFAFSQTPRLQSDVAAFHTSTAFVEPAAYDAARARLRKQMDALLGGGR